jgi:hypothetical protein
MPPPLPPRPRRAPKPALWSAPARLRTAPPPPPRVQRRTTPANEDRKVPILIINFALFLLYVFTLFVLASGPDSELRLALPLGLAVFGLAGFAPLALSRRGKSKASTRRRALPP